MKRLFYGIELDDSVRSRLAQVAALLRGVGVVAGNWSDPSLYHITVWFIGEADDGCVHGWRQAGEAVVREVAPFQLTVSGLGSFARSRVLWAGVGGPGVSALNQMHAALKDAARRLAGDPGGPGIRVDSRPLSPHVTLARKLDTASMRHLRSVEGRIASLLGTDPFFVDHLTLFESVRSHGRLAYPAVARLPLSGPVPGAQGQICTRHPRGSSV
ncbi:MAG: RNA 2',3'-cyclic phosphodiesterase [Alicyclobacillaceae bacterium]|nr:RNA 2',3'-cyclic phosphodiesterase [Alicyclobacillaceae bacterium]